MIHCGCCGTLLNHINEPCPNCLPGMAWRPPTYHTERDDYCYQEQEKERRKQEEKMRADIKKIKTLVEEQANDEGLWFIAETAPEAYLQQALRKLHRVIEEEC